MVNYTTIIGSLKRSILNFTDKISAGMSRPFRKFTADICYGAMSSQSCVISEIAQELQEQAKKIHIIQRLTRNLNEEIPKTVQDNYLGIVKRHLPDHIVVHIDNSDVIKPSGHAFEGISRVRDGSKSTATKNVMGNGYYVTEATAMTKSSHPVSVFSEIWSTESPAFVSGGQLEFTKKVIKDCTKKFDHATYVMDRGYDDNDVFRLLEKLHQNYVIRLKLNRKIRINGTKYSIEDLCSKYIGKYTTKVIYHGRVRKAKLSVVHGCLSGSERPLSIILVYGLSDHPMVLATNLPTNTKEYALRAMRLYFSRWKIEEYFRCKKQMFSFENFRIRSLTAINSLNFSCLLVCSFLLFSEKPAIKT